MKVVITGGHHSSALPVIKKLRAEYPDVQVYWFGHKFSAQGDKNPTLEFHEVTALGIPFYHIHAGKFYRTLNLKRLAKIPFGFFQCFYLLAKIKPDVILSFGGYLAVPTVITGWVWGIPSVTHEQTVVAGWANRLVSRFARRVLISWPESKKYFPKEKTVFVGLPLREEIWQVKSNSFIFNNNLPTVYITTGKIGSHLINKMVGGCLGDLLGLCNVIHQCGDNSVFNDFEMLNKTWEDVVESGTRVSTALLGKYYLRKFIFQDEIGEAYKKSNLVVSRSGAHTAAELLALKKPCLLVPIPWVSHNEQHENAKVLVDAGLGRILPEKDLSVKSLMGEIKDALENMGQTGKTLGLDTRIGSEPANLIVQNLMSIIRK